MSGKLLCLLFLLCSPLAIALSVRSLPGTHDTDDDTETSTETDDDADTDNTLTIARNVRSADDETDEETDTETETDEDDDEGVAPGFSPIKQMVAGPPPVTEPQEECFNISVSVPEYVEHEDVAISDGMTIVNVTVLQDNSISGACNYVITDTAMYVNSTCSAEFEICLLPVKA